MLFEISTSTAECAILIGQFVAHGTNLEMLK